MFGCSAVIEGKRRVVDGDVRQRECDATVACRLAARPVDGTSISGTLLRAPRQRFTLVQNARGPELQTASHPIPFLFSLGFKEMDDAKLL